MEPQSIVDFDEEASNPLLRRASPDTESREDAEAGKISSPASSGATALVIFSTLISVLGSYVFGTAVSTENCNLTGFLTECYVRMQVGFSSPAQSGIVNDLGLSIAEYSVFGSIWTIGAMLGAIISGKIADFFGRRVAMGFAELFCLVGWTAISFSQNAWLLDIGRFLAGYGVGILSYVVPVYIAEITPKNLRGAFTAVNQLMICCGGSVMYVIGNFTSWRTLALIGTIPCILQLLGLFLIPESPRWLAKMDKWKECETSLQRLRGANANISQEAAEIIEYTEMLKQLSDTGMIDLFQRKYAHGLIVGVGLMVLQQFGGVNAIAYYASAIFESAGVSSRTGTLAMVVIQVPMTLLGTLLTDKSGRVPLLMISATGTLLGCFLTGLSFLLQDLQLWKDSPLLALIGVLIFTGSFSLGMGGIPWVIMSEGHFSCSQSQVV
ncbi:sugar transporter ERD6-like 5 isoform X3 [Coffea arabica]|uniref:Sugar transporter ERD6-like 5 isoform X3 n=1 Tax=Coffea arabica TaxID=13443 RepID=A0ABM4WYM8_COFAR